MKYLNKNFPNSPLNKKIRFLYHVKQEINNSPIGDPAKYVMMWYCDCEINRCWRLSQRGVPGYEIK